MYRVVSCSQDIAQQHVNGHGHFADGHRQMSLHNSASTGTDVLLAVADRQRCMTHCLLLNCQNGPVVHGPWAQANCYLYKAVVQDVLDNMEGLELVEGGWSIC